MMNIGRLNHIYSLFRKRIQIDVIFVPKKKTFIHLNKEMKQQGRCESHKSAQEGYEIQMNAITADKRVTGQITRLQ